MPPIVEAAGDLLPMGDCMLVVLGGSEDGCWLLLLALLVMLFGKVPPLALELLVFPSGMCKCSLNLVSYRENLTSIDRYFR